MNVRKKIDYSHLFEALDQVMASELSQMEQCREIGKLIIDRPEKGAAVAAAEYLQARYPDVGGFSPRNVRRMREFVRTYESDAPALRAAMQIGWTQNVVIMEATLNNEERAWYICAVRLLGWTKLVLQSMIEERAHEHIDLDMEEELCYTESNQAVEEAHDESAICVSREHMQKPDGRVRDEGHGAKSWAVEGDTCLLGSNDYRRDRQPGLCPGSEETHRTWYQLRGQGCTSDALSRLQAVRPDHRDGSGEPLRYAPYLPWRPRGQDPSADGLYRPPKGCRGPLVHKGLRGNMARCRGRMPRTVGAVAERYKVLTAVMNARCFPCLTMNSTGNHINRLALVAGG